MTDAERGTREWRQLLRMVEDAFRSAEKFGGQTVKAERRARIQLTEQPSFANHRQWTVWGPVASDEEVGLLRRLVWRADLDGPRGDPLWRTRNLGRPVEPTIEVAERNIPVVELQPWLTKMPALSPLESGLSKPLGIQLDGAHYAIELNTRAGNCVFEWYSVQRDATPTANSYGSLAKWYVALRAWMDKRLED